VLVEDVAVGHLQRVRVAQVDLLLSASPLALGELHRHPRRLHPVPDGADQGLLLRRLEDVVVLEVARDRGEAVVALGPRLVEGLAEEIELELGGRLDPVAGARRALELAAQHPARGFLDRQALLGVDIAEHERGLGQPRQRTPRGEIGDQLHVPVAALPGGQLEAGQRLHLHVHREEVDAGVYALVQDVIQEVAPDHPLAHEAAEPVGEHREHGVDVALPDERLEPLGVHCPFLRHGHLPGWRRAANGRKGGAKRRNLTPTPSTRAAEFGVRSYIPTFSRRAMTSFHATKMSECKT
jgi:hypothetical protein